MTSTANILRITDLFDAWRAMGSRRLRNGVELIAFSEVDEEATWLHAVFPPLQPFQLDRMERALGRPLPRSLRTLYRCIGGLSVFAGLFDVHGYRAPGVMHGDAALQANCLVELNRGMRVHAWVPPRALAFAVNGWDLSVYLLGMRDDGGEVVRCDRSTGAILETHANVFECIDNRLNKLDQLMLA